MPEIGELRQGREIDKQPKHKFIWSACLLCGKERWVWCVRGKPKTLICESCNVKSKTGEHSPFWKGGRNKDGSGYIQIRLYPDDFFFPMATNRGRVREHRLVVAKALGRCLQPWELVHHKKGFAKDDNRYPETLQLVTDDRHNQITILENRIRRLEKQVTLLKAEIITLRKEKTLSRWQKVS